MTSTDKAARIEALAEKYLENGSLTDRQEALACAQDWIEAQEQRDMGAADHLNWVVAGIPASDQQGRIKALAAHLEHASSVHPTDARAIAEAYVPLMLR